MIMNRRAFFKSLLSISSTAMLEILFGNKYHKIANAHSLEWRFIPVFSDLLKACVQIGNPKFGSFAFGTSQDDNVLGGGFVIAPCNRKLVVHGQRSKPSIRRIILHNGI